jgi:hypothetical protein
MCMTNLYMTRPPCNPTNPPNPLDLRSIIAIHTKLWKAAILNQTLSVFYQKSNIRGGPGNILLDRKALCSCYTLLRI